MLVESKSFKFDIEPESYMYFETRNEDTGEIVESTFVLWKDLWYPELCLLLAEKLDSTLDLAHEILNTCEQGAGLRKNHAQ